MFDVSDKAGEVIKQFLEGKDVLEGKDDAGSVRIMMMEGG